MNRIKTTEELQESYYPNHMLWMPVQDILGYIESRKKEINAALSDYDAGIVELDQIRIKIENEKARMEEE